MVSANFGSWAVAILVALIGAGGTYLGLRIRSGVRRMQERDILNNRILKLFNYARSLQVLLEHNHTDYPGWPDNLYDSDKDVTS